MIEWAEEVNAKAKSNIEKAQEKQKKQFDAKHKPPTFQPGDRVWVYNSRKDTRQGGKLEWNWNGGRREADKGRKDSEKANRQEEGENVKGNSLVITCALFDMWNTHYGFQVTIISFNLYNPCRMQRWQLFLSP